MKKVVHIFALTALFTLSISVIILSTIGIETSRFNNFISKKINQTNNNINLKLTSIKFKLDVKEISLFLETLEPKIYYRKVSIPTKNIKVYIDFISLIKSKPEIKKINLILEKLEINQLKEIITTFKPSNLKSLINNKVKQANLFSEIELYLDEKNSLKNFIVKGKVTNLETEITKGIFLEKTNFTFFADKTDILIKSIFGELDSIKIKDGDIKINLLSDISLQSNFITNFKYKNNSFNKYDNLLKNFKFAEDVINLEADLNNNLSIIFDKTYKIKNYSFENTGKILNASFLFKKPLINNFLKNDIKKLSLINSEIKTSINSNKNNMSISGKYSINKDNFLNFNLQNKFSKNLLNLKISFDYQNDFNIDLINFKKPSNSIANLSLDLKKKNNNIDIKKISFREKNNFISLENIKFYKNKFISFKNVLVKTNKNGKKNNDFSIYYGKKIKIKGSQFDATNLPKFLSKKRKKNSLFKINKEIEIDFINIIAPLSKNLKNFKLIGLIEKGKFIKISSKGDFGNNKFLDISMKNDSDNKKKYLEIYSDLPQPLLTEYNFFNGLAGGNLLYTSVIEEDESNSKLKLENFKVINAPGMVKLLSLADLGGLADLAEGEGLSFDILEINMNDNKGFLKLNEIIAIGPSVSVLMEGYKDQNGLTSLRGTLVPAKNLNKLISKIPVLGDIIIPKQVGEGLFGISFKIKGKPGNIKTSINPIKTLTPRFIQRIIDRNKNSK
jgi:hypothetical protein